MPATPPTPHPPLQHRLDCRHIPVPSILSLKLPFSTEDKLFLPAKATRSGTFCPLIPSRLFPSPGLQGSSCLCTFCYSARFQCISGKLPEQGPGVRGGPELQAGTLSHLLAVRVSYGTYLSLSVGDKKVHGKR